MSVPRPGVRAIDPEVTELDLQVVPRASRTKIVGVHGDRIKIQLAAPPVDGAANEALVDFIADSLELPRRSVALRSGATSKRKTVRVDGLSALDVATRLGLLAALCCFGVGCSDIVEQIDIRLVVPEDETPLDAIDNASFTLTPDGFSETFEVDGLDFAFEVELDPDNDPRSLAVYLARGSELVAWGRTPPFVYTAAANVDVAVLAGYPGLLSTFPRTFDRPDADTLAAPVLGAGFVVLGGSGSTAFFDAYTLDLYAGSSYPDEVPPADQGVFLGDNLGGVTRLTWHETLTGRRFEIDANDWNAIEYGDADLASARNGAAHRVAEGLDRVWLFGGGDRTDAVAVPLVPGDDGLDVTMLEGVVLDGPRRGATAVAVGPEPTDTLLIGGEDPAAALVFAVGRGQASGPTGRWTDATCVSLSGTEGILCAGGLRDDAPTADAIVVRDADTDAPTVELVAGFLPVAMADPRWFEGPDAVYAQGASRWVRVDRTTLERSEPSSATVRDRGGSSVSFVPAGDENSGPPWSFLVGGTDLDGNAVERWQVFVPPLPPE